MAKPQPKATRGVTLHHGQGIEDGDRRNTAHTHVGNGILRRSRCDFVTCETTRPVHSHGRFWTQRSSVFLVSTATFASSPRKVARINMRRHSVLFTRKSPTDVRPSRRSSRVDLDYGRVKFTACLANFRAESLLLRERKRNSF
jgi:hypothetical protein